MMNKRLAITMALVSVLVLGGCTEELRRSAVSIICYPAAGTTYGK